MISGPVFPRTRAGLFELVERRLDDVERGLVAVHFDVELEPGHVVDALARDAAGHPCLLFVVDPEGEAEVAARVLATRAWLAGATSMLARVVPLPGGDWSLPSRTLVLGFDFSAAALQQLAELPRGTVEVYRLRPFRVGGEALIGVQPLLGAGAADEHDSFRAPAELPDPKAQAHSAALLDAVQRLDPGIQVVGDRYSRRFSYGGRRLGELRLCKGVLCLSIGGAPGGEPEVLELATADQSLAAIDRLARHFLDATVGTCLDRADDTSPDTSPDTSLENRIRVEPPARGSAPADRSELARSDRGPDGSAPLGPLRDVVEQGRQLSDQEYGLLGQALDDD